ncbi:MAG: hypothetical protein SGBAC_010707 [Bacillariaceae sp.]
MNLGLLVTNKAKEDGPPASDSSPPLVDPAGMQPSRGDEVIKQTKKLIYAASPKKDNELRLASGSEEGQVALRPLRTSGDSSQKSFENKRELRMAPGVVQDSESSLSSNQKERELRMAPGAVEGSGIPPGAFRVPGVSSGDLGDVAEDDVDGDDVGQVGGGIDADIEEGGSFPGETATDTTVIEAERVADPSAPGDVRITEVVNQNGSRTVTRETLDENGAVIHTETNTLSSIGLGVVAPMDDEDPPLKWYKKKRSIAAFIVLVLAVVGAIIGISQGGDSVVYTQNTDITNVFEGEFVTWKFTVGLDLDRINNIRSNETILTAYFYSNCADDELCLEGEVAIDALFTTITFELATTPDIAVTTVKVLLSGQDDSLLVDSAVLLKEDDPVNEWINENDEKLCLSTESAANDNCFASIDYGTDSNIVVLQPTNWNFFINAGTTKDRPQMASPQEPILK